MSAKQKMNKRLRRGDQVIVISGNDKGRVGEVLNRTEDRVLVKGINIRKKTVRKSQNQPQGAIIDMEMPIHASKVMLCQGEEKGVRLKAREGAKGERELFYKMDGKETVHRNIKQQKK